MNKDEYRILRAAGPYWQPEAADVDLVSDMMRRGLLRRRDGFDVIVATDAGRDYAEYEHERRQVEHEAQDVQWRWEQDNPVPWTRDGAGKITAASA
jgi:hypothetical protein